MKDRKKGKILRKKLNAAQKQLKKIKKFGEKDPAQAARVRARATTLKSMTQNRKEQKQRKMKKIR